MAVVDIVPPLNKSAKSILLKLFPLSTLCTMRLLTYHADYAYQCQLSAIYSYRKVT